MECIRKAVSSGAALRPVPPGLIDNADVTRWNTKNIQIADPQDLTGHPNILVQVSPGLKITAFGLLSNPLRYHEKQWLYGLLSGGPGCSSQHAYEQSANGQFCHAGKHPADNPEGWERMGKPPGFAVRATDNIHGRRSANLQPNDLIFAKLPMRFNGR
jgi:hypothetical protein